MFGKLIEKEVVALELPEGMGIVELIQKPSEIKRFFEKYGFYSPNSIGLKFSEPIDFYVPFDRLESANEVFENIPNKENTEASLAQPFKNLSLSTNFSYKTKEMDSERRGMLQIVFIDWNPSAKLGEPQKAGNQGYLRDIIGSLETGGFLGEILASKDDFKFLASEELFENSDQIQAQILVTDFSDDFSKVTSSLEKMLTFTNKAGQEIPVCVWPEANAAHEQNK